MPDHHHHEHDHGADHQRGHYHEHGHGHTHGGRPVDRLDRPWSVGAEVVVHRPDDHRALAGRSGGPLRQRGPPADTIHNFADAATAIPLGIAFLLVRRGATRRFTYGLGRVEDLAGLIIVLTIAVSAVIAFYEAWQRLLHPQPVGLLWAVMVASVVGFVGNEMVAVFRIRVGRQIGSAALIADGYHARADGWTSLAVLLGAIGVWVGYPLADPIVGMLISVTIFVIVWQSARSVLVRMLDGVDVEVLETIEHASRHVPLEEVTDVRARWIGHRLHADVSISVSGGLSVEDGHEIAKDVRHQLLHHLSHLGSAMVHVDPLGQGGERHHAVREHAHDGLPVHPHE